MKNLHRGGAHVLQTLLDGSISRRGRVHACASRRPNMTIIFCGIDLYCLQDVPKKEEFRECLPSDAPSSSHVIHPLPIMECFLHRPPVNKPFRHHNHQGWRQVLDRLPMQPSVSPEECWCHFRPPRQLMPQTSPWHSGELGLPCAHRVYPVGFSETRATSCLRPSSIPPG